MWLSEPAPLCEPIELPPAPLGGIEMIHDPKGIRERVEQLSGSARHSICALQPHVGGRAGRPALPRPIPTRLVVENGSAGEYGSVTVRCSADPLPCRMVIIDEAIAVAAGQGSAGRGVAMVVEEPVLVQGLLCLFEATWAACLRATPDRLTPDRPTPDERSLLERMAAGSTDEAIARRLGISDRQVRRRIARLLQRLGASSRFAAGAEAVRRGWL
ncbi:MAG TPA: helix-turn-helix domain-containing protein [Jatrophihabitans sp.]|nr:helix-turn-helix domain-containing protein [Jatrophihabitans sp.]